MNDFGIYAIITKPKLPYEILAKTFVDEGILMVQLREKHLSDRKLMEVGHTLKKIFQGTPTRFIIDDRPDLVLLLDADGIHIGQEDLHVEDVRTILPRSKIIGISTHNLHQLKEALQYKPDYVGFGPIYPTVTKENPDPVVGVSMLKEALNKAHIPVVAIGGIFPENIDEVLRAGARNLCMVRYFMEATTKEELIARIRFVKQKISKHDPNAISPNGQNNQ
ncbi:MAG: thiamine phosphate synthase [Bacteroidales bacterium]|nr:thiamine phosphate synthase [Bacteroidales bacterium]